MFQTDFDFNWLNNDVIYQPVSHEQHVSWAITIEAGLFANEKLISGDFLPDDYEDLLTLKTIGEKNLQAFQSHNLRLVRHLARKFGSRLSLEDKFQNAFFGLNRAIQGWDYKQGYAFSTYATWWIRQALTRSVLDQAYGIRIPVHMHEKLASNDLNSQIVSDNNETIYSSAIDAARYAIKDHFSFEVFLEELPELLEGDICWWEDFVFDSAAFEDLRMRLNRVFDTLALREVRVLSLRFGLEGGRAHTLDEIGFKLGVTRERIRQIESKTFSKLRHPARSDSLKDFLDVDF